MSRVIATLVRHGDYAQPEGVPSAHLPYPLTELGQAQAREAVVTIANMASRDGLRIAEPIASSRMLRAFQTATILAQGLAGSDGRALRVEEHDALAERGLGAAANLTVEAIEAIVRADPRYAPLPSGWKSDGATKLPFQGAESLIEAGRRVADCVVSICDRLARSVQQDTLAIFVGHGGAFRHAAVHLGVLELAAVPGLSMHHCRPILLERGSDRMPWRHVAGEWKKRSSGERATD